LPLAPISSENEQVLINALKEIGCIE